MPVLSNGRLVARSQVRGQPNPNVRRKRRQRVRNSVGLTPQKRSYRLYALRLVDDCYYVGMTAYRDVSRRFAQHVSGHRGARWTKLHKPIEILETRELGYVSKRSAEQAEDMMTLEFIERYGLDGVRGGSMCQVKPRNGPVRLLSHVKHKRILQATGQHRRT